MNDAFVVLPGPRLPDTVYFFPHGGPVTTRSHPLSQKLGKRVRSRLSSVCHILLKLFFSRPQAPIILPAFLRIDTVLPSRPQHQLAMDTMQYAFKPILNYTLQNQLGPSEGNIVVEIRVTAAGTAARTGRRRTPVAPE